MNAKYFKPKSVTWWTGIACVAGGFVSAAGPEIGGPIQSASNVILSVSGVGPAAMFAAGLGLIGLRGATD